MSSQDGGWQKVATLDAFQQQRKLVIRLDDGIEVLLLRSGEEIVALHNYCSHLGKPLDRGRVMAGQISCPFHGACFDLKTGAALSGPAVLPLHLFPVRLDGQDIWLDLARKPAHPLAGFAGRL